MNERKKNKSGNADRGRINHLRQIRKGTLESCTAVFSSRPRSQNTAPTTEAQMTSGTDHLCDCFALPASVSGGAHTTQPGFKIQLDSAVTKPKRGIAASSAVSRRRLAAPDAPSPPLFSSVIYLSRWAPHVRVAISADNGLWLTARPFFFWVERAFLSCFVCFWRIHNISRDIIAIIS